MRLILVMLIFAAPLAGAVPKDGKKTEEIRRLIKDLGAAKFSMRKKAKERLKQLGYAARRELIKHQDAKDPEIRTSVAEILQELRWEIIPDAADEVKSLIDELKQGNDGKDVWDRIAREHPVKIIDLIVEISRDKKLSDKVHTGIYPFLLNTLPEEAAEHIRGLPDDDRRVLISLIDQAYIDLSETKREQMFLFYCLGDYKRTISRAREYWAASRITDAVAIDIAAVAFVQAGRPNDVWETAGERCLSETNPSTKCRKLTFYVGMAKRLRQPAIARSLLRIAADGLHTCSPDALQVLVDMLDEMDMKKEADNLLNGRQDPWLMYEFLCRFNKQMGTDMQPDDLKKIMFAAKTEEQLWRFATNVARYNIEHAMTAFETIIKTPPMASNYDTQARYRMAQIEEDQGNLLQAADHYAEYAKLREKARSMYPEHTVAMKLHAKELRELAKHVTPAYTAAMKKAFAARLQKNDDEAIKAYNEAIKAAPTISTPYDKLLSLYREHEHYGPYRATARAMVAQEPATTKDLAVWASAFADMMEFGVAQEFVDRYKQKLSADYVIQSIQAQIDERTGKLDKALKYYSASGGGNALRQVGLIQLKQGRYPDGVKMLRRHLVYNPFDEYARLWLFIGRSHLKIDDRKAINRFIATRCLPANAWSTNLLRYYAGTLSREKLLAASNAAEDAIRPARLCEAQFYIAELDLIDGKTDLAQKGFRNVMSHNIPMYIEHHWAAHELTTIETTQNAAPVDK